MYYYADYLNYDPADQGLAGPAQLCKRSFGYYEVTYTPGLTYNWQCSGATVSNVGIVNNKLRVIVETGSSFTQATLTLSITGGCTGSWPTFSKTITLAPNCQSLAKSEQELVVYPNPANNEVTIQSQDSSYKQVIILDSDHQKFASEIILEGNSRKFDVTHWKRGEYTVILIDNEGKSAFRKLVLE